MRKDLVLLLVVLFLVGLVCGVEAKIKLFLPPGEKNPDVDYESKVRNEGVF